MFQWHTEHTDVLPLGYPLSPRPEPPPMLVAGVFCVPTPPRGGLFPDAEDMIKHGSVNCSEFDSLALDPSIYTGPKSVRNRL